MRGLGLGIQNDALVYPGELNSIDSVLYEGKESELIARGGLALKTDDPEWVEHISWDKLTKSGEAKLLSGSVTRYPLVDVDMERASARVFTLATGFRLTRDEVQAARGMGRDIDSTKALTARRFMAEEENSLAFNGDTGAGIAGIFTVVGKTEVAASGNFASGNTHWDAATATEGAIIVNHIRQGRMGMQKYDGYEGRSLFLSRELAEYLVYWVDTTKTITVLQFLTNAGWFPGGIFKSSTMPATKLAILDNRPDQVQLAIPADIERLDPPYQDSPRSVIVAIEERLAGLICRFPLAVSIITGVHS